MNINLHIFKASTRLEPFIKDLEEIYLDAIKKVGDVLPVRDVDIVFYDNPERTIKEISIGGYTPNAHLIYISLNPQDNNFLTNIRLHLGRQISHELHHALRWQNPGYGKTLLEALISEGLADTFSYEVFPGKLEPWDNALNKDELNKISQLAKKEYNNQKYNHIKWFFGKSSEEIPYWSGYSLGFNLVKEYLIKHPSEKASTLYAAKANEFIE